ncbi:mechanosensitive ion channel family protein [Dasania sp. GY-MA-18]|uniref:Mechanosensitive ion channel family protein n=1 Tax=Dasania phycosphaerae TaxID=2950436 RepID=A0A9J6RI43_9GAMM|nr:MULTISPECIES: mechanosensitive ion channel family protein [Dasania]MCR8921922.1 mechanosensitive ion channel family protein [Dasania sp. GY-MA-18]MCZ0864350.1 mechanosensitive ion channel family protein [Dasania phycosphaerae]MCZ0868078.1 mechanosensitive ion channel family protein [Dasania phycosphaerae]
MDKEFLQTVLGLFQSDDFPWLWEVFVVVLLTLFASYLVRFLFARLEQQFKKTANKWDDAIFAAGRKPAFLMVWLLGASLVLDILRAKSEAYIFTIVAPAREVLVIILLTWFLVRLVKRIEQQLIAEEGTETPVDEATIFALGKLFRTAIIITASLMVLQTMGFSISGVLAFGGVGGIAIGFAAKDLLANFFGGLMVYLDRPFIIGDWIRSPDKQIEGTVEYIGWRQTRIRTFDQRPLYVPNSTFTQIAVENPSRMLNRRINETIGLRYDDADKVGAIVADVKEYLLANEDIDTEKTLMVNFNAFAASSLDFFIYTFTKTTNWVEYHKIKQQVLLDILAIIDKHGADIAYPTSTLKVDPLQIAQQAALSDSQSA